MSEPSKHLLLVEDEAPLREAIDEQLGDRGYQVQQAGSGEEAIERLGDFAFDIIIAAALVILRIDPNAQYGPVFMVGFAAAFAFLPPFVAVLLLRRELNARSEAGLCGSMALTFALMLATGGAVLTCFLLPFVFIVAGWIIGGFAGKISWDVLRG
jgi:hypothetical protein